MGPLVTIGIPTFQRLAFLTEAVESALAQTWTNIEVLVGDNGTTTEIPDWCHARAERDPRLHYHRNPRDLGVAGNWNAIAGRARGEFILLQGDDDRLLPQCIETLVRAAAPDSLVVFANHHVIDRDGRKMDEETIRATRHYHRADLVAGALASPAASAWQNAIPASAAMVRRRDVVRLQFHEDMNSQDCEFFVRLATEGGRFDFVPEYLVEYRVHGASLTSTGLRHEALTDRLLSIPAAVDVEPFKRDLLAHLLVTAVSRCLTQGDWPHARAFLNSGYYPRASSRVRYLTQRACTLLPQWVGAPAYRSMLRLKQAIKR
jgi:glycosyltransferase involved in cell wall biosynthesis